MLILYLNINSVSYMEVFPKHLMWRVDPKRLFGVSQRLKLTESHYKLTTFTPFNSENNWSTSSQPVGYFHYFLSFILFLFYLWNVLLSFSLCKKLNLKLTCSDPQKLVRGPKMVLNPLFGKRWSIEGGICLRSKL